MKRKIIAIVFTVVGVIMLSFSLYILYNVAKGKEEIRVGQSQVDAANDIFAGSNLTKQIGKKFTASGQQQIEAGKEEANYYETLGIVVLVGGLLFIVTGGYVFYTNRRRMEVGLQ